MTCSSCKLKAVMEKAREALGILAPCVAVPARDEKLVAYSIRKELLRGEEVMLNALTAIGEAGK